MALPPASVMSQLQGQCTPVNRDLAQSLERSSESAMVSGVYGVSPRSSSVGLLFLTCTIPIGPSYCYLVSRIGARDCSGRIGVVDFAASLPGPHSQTASAKAADTTSSPPTACRDPNPSPRNKKANSTVSGASIVSRMLALEAPTTDTPANKEKLAIAVEMSAMAVSTAQPEGRTRDPAHRSSG